MPIEPKNFDPTASTVRHANPLHTNPIRKQFTIVEIAVVTAQNHGTDNITKNNSQSPVIVIRKIASVSSIPPSNVASAKRIRGIDIEKRIWGIVLRNQFKSRFVFDDNTPEPLNVSSKMRRIIDPIACRRRPRTIRIRTKPGSIVTVRSCGTKASKRSQDRKACSLNITHKRRPVLKRSIEFRASKWSQFESTAKLSRFFGIPQNAENINHHIPQIVIDLRIRPRLLQQDRSSTTERLDINPMIGKVRNHPLCQLPFSPVISQCRTQSHPHMPDTVIWKDKGNGAR